MAIQKRKFCNFARATPPFGLRSYPAVSRDIKARPKPCDGLRFYSQDACVFGAGPKLPSSIETLNTEKHTYTIYYGFSGRRGPAFSADSYTAPWHSL